MKWDGRIKADARHLPIADESVQCVVTSPPYWGLRDYGNDGQIGLESTPEAYVESLRSVFVEIWRVLKTDGTAWLNLGDSYSGAGPSGASYQSKTTIEREGKTRSGNFAISKTLGARGLTYAEKKPIPAPGLKAKDLVGIPWRVAFALQADGWYLRSDIIWHKPNPMPESVTDRPTRSHEYIFLLSKSERYSYNADAIAERASYPNGPNSPDAIKSPHGQGFTRRALQGRPARRQDPPGMQPDSGKTAVSGLGRNQSEAIRIHGNLPGRSDNGAACNKPDQITRNKRDVWTVATAPYAEAHYATFPPKLIEPCILAGSKPGDIVLDPFFGSGTVGMVCEKHGRRWLGIDLGYQELQAKRVTDVQKALTFA